MMVYKKIVWYSIALIGSLLLWYGWWYVYEYHRTEIMYHFSDDSIYYKNIWNKSPTQLAGLQTLLTIHPMAWSIYTDVTKSVSWNTDPGYRNVVVVPLSQRTGAFLSGMKSDIMTLYVLEYQPAMTKQEESLVNTSSTWKTIYELASPQQKELFPIMLSALFDRREVIMKQEWYTPMERDSTSFPTLDYLNQNLTGEQEKMVIVVVQ